MSKTSVGPYSLQLPDFWVSGSLREKPGFFGYNAVAVPGVSFALNVLVNFGDNTEEKQRIVNGMVSGYAPQRHLSSRTTFMGILFEAHRLEDTAPLGPGSVYEIYLTSAYGDLLMMGFGFTTPLEQEASIRHLLLTIVHGAIIQSGYERHQP